MQNKIVHWSQHIALCAAASLSLATSAEAAQNCVAGTWQSPPNSYWDANNASFPVQAESTHFQIRYSANKPNLLTPQQAADALKALEDLFAWFTGPQVNWPEPFCDSATKHKTQIFTDPGYGLSGAGGGTRTPAMWVNPNALIDAPKGMVSGLAHEYTHTMQFSTVGLRNTEFGGWFWESHAEFMAHQYPANADKTGCTTMAAWMPHLYYGSTRDRYCNWQFWDYLKNKYGFSAINNIWLKSANQNGKDPLAVLMGNMGWSASLLGDEFGYYAMKNVNWDYVDAQDGFNRGAVYRAIYGKNTAMTNPWGQASQRLRLAKLEPVDLAKRRFVVSTYFAPQRYGYNLVRLIPDTGATSVTVNFRGVVQSAIASGAQVGGTGAFQPGATPNWVNFPMPTNPASNWRWGVVAIDKSGNSRSSALQRGTSADMTFALQTGDQELYLVVVATPDQHFSIFWDQMYHTLYRYPYKVQLTGAMPDGYQSGYSLATANEYPAGHKHANGGGWVSDTAKVDASAYVGPFAAVLGGSVLGNARIEDYAAVWNGTVKDNVVVGGLTQLNANMTLSGNAQVRSVMAGGATFDWGSVLGGTVKLFGDLETHLGTTPLTAGAYSGILDGGNVGKAEYGATRTSQPVEVTAPVPTGWPSVLVDGIYELVAVHSGQALDVGGVSTASGAQVIQWPWLGGNNQRWKLTAQGNGQYTLAAQHSQQLLEVAGCNTSNGARVQQWPANGAACQRWRIEDLGDGSYRLVNVNSGKVLGINGVSKTNGTAAVQWTFNGSPDQRWRFVKQ